MAEGEGDEWQEARGMSGRRRGAGHDGAQRKSAGRSGVVKDTKSKEAIFDGLSH